MHTPTLTVEAEAAFLNVERLDGTNALRAAWQAIPELQKHFDSERVFLAWHRNRHRSAHLVAGAVHGGDRELLAGGLKGLGYRNVQGNYWMSYEDQLSQLWYPRVCTTVDTDSAQEIYKWLSSVPNPRKWTGERTRQNLTDYGITVSGDKYELTIPVDIDDLRRDKTGQILAKVNDAGARMAEMPQELAVSALEANGTTFDGLSLFNTAHNVLQSGSQSNDVTCAGNVDPDNPTSAEMVRVILKLVQQARGLKNERGQPANPQARKFVLLYPTKYFIAVTAALNDIFTSAGVSNTLKNSGLEIAGFDDARLTGTAATAGRRLYLFREDARIRGLIFQDESLPDAFKSQGPESETGFWQDSVAWGAKRICVVAPGQFVLALRATLTT